MLVSGKDACEEFGDWRVCEDEDEDEDNGMQDDVRYYKFRIYFLSLFLFPLLLVFTIPFLYV